MYAFLSLSDKQLKVLKDDQHSTAPIQIICYAPGREVLVSSMLSEDVIMQAINLAVREPFGNLSYILRKNFDYSTDITELITKK